MKFFENVDATKKVDCLATAGTINDVVKFGSMAIATGTYIAKVAKVPVISTAVCFASVIADVVISHLIVNNDLYNDEFDDLEEELFDEDDFVEDDVAAETLREIAEESVEPETTEAPETEDYKEVPSEPAETEAE